MNTGPTLRPFRRHLVARGYSVHTARHYTGKAEAFVRWLDGRSVTARELRAYRDHLRGAGHTQSSIRGSLAALSLLFRYLELNRLATGLPPVPPPLDAHESRQGQRRRPEGEVSR